MKTDFKTIDEKYNLEIEKIVKSIKKQKIEKVLLQFPEGLKPYSQAICDEISNKVDVECLIWMGTCFGACDLPLGVEKMGVDLVVQFGHSAWNYSDNKEISVL